MIEWFIGVTGGLVVLIKSLMLYIWVKHERKLEDVSTHQANLERSLMLNYYDRNQTERYVDKELSSVQQSIDRLADVIVPLTLELRKLNEKVLVLETKEYLNGKSGGSS
jgi:predicted transport protein